MDDHGNKDYNAQQEQYAENCNNSIDPPVSVRIYIVVISEVNSLISRNVPFAGGDVVLSVVVATTQNGYQGGIVGPVSKLTRSKRC